MDISPQLAAILRRQFKNSDLNYKLTFSEFLQLLQKEDFFRDTLSKAQLFRMSPYRFNYAGEL
jgi:hypothetical protein